MLCPSVSNNFPALLIKRYLELTVDENDSSRKVSEERKWKNAGPTSLSPRAVSQRVARWLIDSRREYRGKRGTPALTLIKKMSSSQEGEKGQN